MSNKIEIVIPNFVNELRLSESRRKIYYNREDIDTLPKKFFSSGTVLRQPYSWKKDRVFNTLTKEFPYRNTGTAGTPRIKSIAGNDIWGSTDKHLQQAMTEAIKNDFRPHLPKSLGLRYPVLIDCEVHTVPRFCNWDVGNLWVYDKVFEDLLQEEGLLPNDNILYITKSGGPRYIPILDDKDRKMIFTLTEDTDPRVTSHVIYNLNEIKEYIMWKGTCDALLNFELEWGRNLIIIKTTHDGEPGSIFYDKRHWTVWISSGKKKLAWGAVRKGLASIFSLALQQNAHLSISHQVYEKFHRFIDEELRLRGLTIFLYDERGDDLPGNTQNVNDKIQA